MSSRKRPIVASALILSLIGCTSSVFGRGGGDAAPSSGNAATIINATDLSRTSFNLLAALSSKLVGMQVRTNGSACPQITLRGRHSILGDNSPAVYVDGTRAVNTCVLDMLQTVDVSRVEVYPMGVPPRMPYKGHPNGLILVFMSDGRTAASD